MNKIKPAKATNYNQPIGKDVILNKTSATKYTKMFIRLCKQLEKDINKKIDKVVKSNINSFKLIKKQYKVIKRHKKFIDQSLFIEAKQELILLKMSISHNSKMANIDKDKNSKNLMMFHMFMNK